MTASPRARRPAMTKGYGIADAMPDPAPDWSAVEAKLAGSRNYWISTVSPDGRPHVMPVWGLYFDGAIHFSTDPGSRKGRNLAATGAVNVHLESGDDVVIVEGRVRQVAAKTLPAALFDAYNEKYSFRPDPDDASGGWYVVEPHRAFTWTEADFPNTAVRWDFDQAPLRG